MITLDLAGRSAAVVGGNGGIGRATVAALARAGARAAVIDAVPVGPDATPCPFIEADVSQPDAARSAIERAVDALGRLDHLVYCAGITRDALLWKLTDAQWREVIDVNLTGAFNVLRAATPHLRERRDRHASSVVLVASINGERGKRGQANYAASKGGLIAFAKSAARELGHFGVRVNVVSPGWIDTPMTGTLPTEVRETARLETALGRTGSPDDVAGAIVFLLSDLAGHVTGQNLRVDGGQLM